MTAIQQPLIRKHGGYRKLTSFMMSTIVCYSPERQIVWSVGPDGVDDGGDKGKDIVIAWP
ncbi:MAG: hypothetical protein WCK89_03640 [bacterium]